MQDKEKISYFKAKFGELLRKVRKSKKCYSLNKLANEYDFNKSNLSKTERGIYSVQYITAWKISEALGIKLSDFTKMLEDELGQDFKLMDE